MWGIHLTQVATRCCGRAKASTKKRIPRLLLWRGVGLRSASDSRSCRPKAATAMNSRVGRLGGHSHDARNLTFLFRSREATTHRVYLNEVDTPLPRILAALLLPFFYHHSLRKTSVVACDGAAQIGEGITDRNQPVALTLHGLFSRSHGQDGGCSTYNSSISSTLAVSKRQCLFCFVYEP